MGPPARWLDAPCSWSQRDPADRQTVQSPAGGEPFGNVTGGENRQAAGLAFGYVAEDPVGPLNTLRSEIVVGKRIVCNQAVNEARRGNFLRFVGSTVVEERFTVGRGRMLVVFSVSGGVGRRPPVGAVRRAIASKLGSRLYWIQTSWCSHSRRLKRTLVMLAFAAVGPNGNEFRYQKTTPGGPYQRPEWSFALVIPITAGRDCPV